MFRTFSKIVKKKSNAPMEYSNNRSNRSNRSVSVTSENSENSNNSGVSVTSDNNIVTSYNEIDNNITHEENAVNNTRGNNIGRVNTIKNSSRINRRNLGTIKKTNKGAFKNFSDENIYKICCETIMKNLNSELSNNISKNNKNYNATYYEFINTLYGWQNLESGLINYLVNIYRDSIKNYNIINLEYPIFYEPTTNIIEVKLNNWRHEFEVKKLYSVIKPTDTIRIWLILGKKGIGRHIASEIITQDGQHFSFGFTYSSKLKGYFTTADLYLMSPDTILNTAISRQLNSIEKGIKYLKLIHESEIGAKSYTRLMDLFDSIFDDKDNLTKNLAKLMVDKNYFKIQETEFVENLNASIQSKIEYKPPNSPIPTAIGEPPNSPIAVGIKRIESLESLEPNETILEKLRSEIKNIKLKHIESLKTNEQVLKQYNNNNYLLTLALGYSWNIPNFLGSKSGYRLIAGKARNLVSRFTNTITCRRGSDRCRKGINCVYAAHLLFEDLINCGDHISIPSKCRTKSLNPTCSNLKTLKNN